MESNNKQIASKIVKVMAAIQSVSKDGYNAFHKYKYATDAAIVSEIRKAMIANNLICIPNQLSCNQNGNMTAMQVQYTVLDADSGEFITSHVYGYGQDTGDKGPYKAATGAEKYFLLKTFLLPTDDDPENEKESKNGHSNGHSEEVDGYDTGVRLPAGWWDLREKDPKAAQDRIGAGYFPRKTAKGWFIFSKEKVTPEAVSAMLNRTTVQDDEPKQVLKGGPTVRKPQ